MLLGFAGSFYSLFSVYYQFLISNLISHWFHVMLVLKIWKYRYINYHIWYSLSHKEREITCCTSKHVIGERDNNINVCCINEPRTLHFTIYKREVSFCSKHGILNASFGVGCGLCGLAAQIDHHSLGIEISSPTFKCECKNIGQKITVN